MSGRSRAIAATPPVRPAASAATTMSSALSKIIRTPLADEMVVVDQGDRDHGASMALTGRSGWSSAASSRRAGPGPASVAPPSAVTRSLIPVRPRPGRLSAPPPCRSSVTRSARCGRPVRDRHLGRVAAGVLDHVRQRLLHDAVDRELDGARQRSGLTLDDDAHREPGVGEPIGQRVDVVDPRRRSPVGIAVEAAEHMVELAERLATDRLDGRERRCARLRVAFEHPAAGAGLQHHHVERVPDDVVDLARDPAALLRDRGGAARSGAAPRPPRPDGPARRRRAGAAPRPGRPPTPAPTPRRRCPGSHGIGDRRHERPVRDDAAEPDHEADDRTGSGRRTRRPSTARSGSRTGRARRRSSWRAITTSAAELIAYALSGNVRRIASDRTHRGRPRTNAERRRVLGTPPLREDHRHDHGEGEVPRERTASRPVGSWRHPAPRSSHGQLVDSALARSDPSSATANGDAMSATAAVIPSRHRKRELEHRPTGVRLSGDQAGQRHDADCGHGHQAGAP